MCICAGTHPHTHLFLVLHQTPAQRRGGGLGRLRLASTAALAQRLEEVGLDSPGEPPVDRGALRHGDDGRAHGGGEEPLRPRVAAPRDLAEL